MYLHFWIKPPSETWIYSKLFHAIVDSHGGYSVPSNGFKIEGEPSNDSIMHINFKLKTVVLVHEGIDKNG